MLFLQNAGAKVQKNHRTAKLFPLFFSLPLFYYKKGIQKFGRLRTLPAFSLLFTALVPEVALQPVIAFDTEDGQTAVLTGLGHAEENGP